MAHIKIIIKKNHKEYGNMIILIITCTRQTYIFHHKCLKNINTNLIILETKKEEKKTNNKANFIQNVMIISLPIYCVLSNISLTDETK